ncbi:MAG: hypothetical protein ACTSPA_01385 [Promethearchaeota archaeon]
MIEMLKNGIAGGRLEKISYREVIIGQLEQQLTTFKKFYFELKEKMEKMEMEENSHSLENFKDNREEEDGNDS